MHKPSWLHIFQPKIRSRVLNLGVTEPPPPKKRRKPRRRQDRGHGLEDRFLVELQGLVQGLGRWAGVCIRMSGNDGERTIRLLRNDGERIHLQDFVGQIMFGDNHWQIILKSDHRSIIQSNSLKGGVNSCCRIVDGNVPTHPPPLYS